MAKFCMLTGLEGEAILKKMCLNCAYSQYNSSEDNYTCINESVMEIGVEKIRNSAKEFGFDIETLTIKPMVLKAPNKKCDKYAPNIEGIKEYIETIFSK